MWSFKPTGKKCKAMEGLIEEGKEVLTEKGEASVIDAALIAAAQRIEHYEIAAYSTAIGHADVLGIDEMTQDLDATLVDHISVERHLREIADTLAAPLTPRPDEPDAHDTNAGVSPR